MRAEVTELAPGVAPEAALAWWSDFRDGHADHAFVPLQRRRILARTDGAVTMEDRIPILWRERTTARKDGSAVAFEGENTYSRFRGRYAFEPHEQGTLVRLVADIELKALLRPTLPLARPIALALLRADLRGHVREMVGDLAPAPSGCP